MDTSSVSISFVSQNYISTGDSLYLMEENISGELSCFAEPQASGHSYTFHVTLLTTISTFCIISNSLVIYTVCTDKKLLTPNNAFILSLAISDLLYGIAFALYNMAHVEFAQSALGHWFVCCPLLIFITTAQMASSNNLVGVSVVRYIMVKHPLRFKSMLTKSHMVKGVICVWLTSFLCAIAFYARPEPEGYCGMCRTELFWKLHNIIIWTLFTIVLPLFIMIILYIKLVQSYKIHIKKVSRYLRGKEQKEKKNIKSLNKVALILVFYFAMSYTPFAVFVLLYQFCECDISAYVRIMVRMMYFSCTTINFFIYMLGYKEFRHSFVSKFCKCKRKMSRRRLNGPLDQGMNSHTDCQSHTDYATEMAAHQNDVDETIIDSVKSEQRSDQASDIFVIKL